MGNCLAVLFGRPRRPRSYFTGRYKDCEVGVEFDNLIEDDNDYAEESNAVSQDERELLVNRQFSKLVENQRRVDAEIDEVLRQEEERTRLEEEAYIAAKREASRITRQARKLEEQKRNKPISNGSAKSWAGDDGDWSIANEEEEEDFDSFLQTVTARSENVRASVASLTNSHLAHTHPNNTPSGMVTFDLLTSDLPWQDLTGIGGLIVVKPEVIPTSVSSASVDQTPSPDSTSSSALFSSHKSDVEWEADFVSAEMEPAPISLPISNGSSVQGTPVAEQNGGGIINSLEEQSEDSHVGSGQNVTLRQNGGGDAAKSPKDNSAPSDVKDHHQNGHQMTIAQSVRVDVKPSKSGTEANIVKAIADSSSETAGRRGAPLAKSSSGEADRKQPTSNSIANASRSASESFSITDEEDEEILDVQSSESAGSSEDDRLGSPILRGGKEGTTKIEADAFDIDIDKFLEELDAEL